MLMMYITIAPNTDIVTMVAVSVCPAMLHQAVAEDRRDADDAAGQDRDVRRVEARVDPRQDVRQVAGARQREHLPRVPDDDAVERGDQAEQAEPQQHVQPAAVLAHDPLHGLRQRVVDVGQLRPVADAAREDHHADGQHARA